MANAKFTISTEMLLELHKAEQEAEAFKKDVQRKMAQAAGGSEAEWKKFSERAAKHFQKQQEAAEKAAQRAAAAQEKAVESALDAFREAEIIAAREALGIGQSFEEAGEKLGESIAKGVRKAETQIKSLSEAFREGGLAGALKQIEERMELFEGVTEALDAVGSAASNMVGIINEDLADLVGRVTGAASAFGQIGAVIHPLAGIAGTAIGAIIGLFAAAAERTKAMEAATRSARREVEDLNRELRGLSRADAKGAVDSLEEVNTKLRDTERALEDIAEARSKNFLIGAIEQLFEDNSEEIRLLILKSVLSEKQVTLTREALKKIKRETQNLRDEVNEEAERAGRPKGLEDLVEDLDIAAKNRNQAEKRLRQLEKDIKAADRDGRSDLTDLVAEKEDLEKKLEKYKKLEDEARSGIDAIKKKAKETQDTYRKALEDIQKAENDLAKTRGSLVPTTAVEDYQKAKEAIEQLQGEMEFLQRQEGETLDAYAKRLSDFAGVELADVGKVLQEHNQALQAAIGDMEKAKARLAKEDQEAKRRAEEFKRQREESDAFTRDLLGKVRQLREMGPEIYREFLRPLLDAVQEGEHAVEEVLRRAQQAADIQRGMAADAEKARAEAQAKYQEKLQETVSYLQTYVAPVFGEVFSNVVKNIEEGNKAFANFGRSVAAGISVALKALGREFAVKAIGALAEGLLLLPNFAAAGPKFAAAAKFGAAAAAAGVAGAVAGRFANRGQGAGNAGGASRPSAGRGGSSLGRGERERGNTFITLNYYAGGGPGSLTVNAPGAHGKAEAARVLDEIQAHGRRAGGGGFARRRAG